MIAGLGNPGSRYDGTRHNAGFDVIDVLVDKYRLYDAERFGKCMMAKGRIEGKRVILMKPMTYMNLSGEAVREVVSYFKVDPSDHLIVISDDRKAADPEKGQRRGPQRFKGHHKVPGHRRLCQDPGGRGQKAPSGL